MDRGGQEGGIMRVHVKRVLCSSCVCTQRCICVHYEQGVVQVDNECSCKVNIVFYFRIPLVCLLFLCSSCLCIQQCILSVFLLSSYSAMYLCALWAGGGPGA